MDNPLHQYESLTRATSHVEQTLGYSFKNKDLLIQAFLHRSYLNESKQEGLFSNERLEFLGDAALNLFVGEFLFCKLKELDEGILSKYKALLVSQASCYTMMEIIGLSQYLVLGRGERQLESYKKPSLSSDLFEAILGALFLDGGWDAVKNFLSNHFTQYFSKCIETPPINAKAALQELVAKRQKGLPQYIVKEEKGPAHEPLFIVAVLIEGVEMGCASGKTKKEAQQKAAELALLKLESL